MTGREDGPNGPGPAGAPEADRRPSRLSALRDGLGKAGLDGVLLSHLPNIRYLTGFSGSSALLLVGRGGSATLFTDFRYEEQADAQLPPDVVPRIVRDGLLAQVADHLAAASAPRRLGFEAAHLTVRDRRELGERCGNVLWEEVPSLVEAARAVKDDGEIRRIRRAARMAERALGAALEGVEEEMTEREVAAEVEYALRRAGSDGAAFPPIVASGPRSSLPHAEPAGRRLREGDLVLIDLGGVAEGYRSDLTRTVVLGAARPWQRDLHAAVAEAQERAIRRLAPGAAGPEVDAAAREALDAHGLADRFGHGTGHGLGLEVHEAPRLSRRSEDVLRAGHVVTVEPGVYLPGRGGVRIEDDVVVTSGGPRPLTGLRKDLVEL